MNEHKLPIRDDGDPRWEPGMRVDVLNGPSSVALGQVPFWSGIAGTLLAGALFVATRDNFLGESGAANATFGMLILAIVCAIVGEWACLRRRRREAEAGYTTSGNSFRELPQVDPETRFVIRLPDEDYLTPKERKQRLEVLRGFGT